ncbi:MAG: CRISPR-associated helicase Cas3' [bacterium]|nr:CRISPR-associated helicase Cas3' [bacterium]
MIEPPRFGGQDAEDHTADLVMSLWGKAGVEAVPHPLLCHCLDVAAVAQRLWDDAVAESARETLAHDVGVADARDLVVLWCALHDLGKASPAFQVMRPDLAPPLEAAGLEFPSGNAVRIGHGQVSGLEIPHVLVDAGYERSSARQIATIVGGHHGRFASPTSLASLNKTPKSLGGGGWRDLRRLVFDELVRVLAPGVNPPTVAKLPDSTAVLLAGLVTVADWIGSDRSVFPYRPDVDRVAMLDAYWDDAQRQATRAVQRLLWRRWDPPVQRSFVGAFGFEARPVQAIVAEIVERERPSMVIIEAPTGIGKTEAALFAAERLAAEQGSGGFFVGLPTQATANQMFTRVGSYLEGLGHSEPQVLQLLHGRAGLSEEFEALTDAGREAGALACSPEAVAEDDPVSPQVGSVVAQEWFARRHVGLLAPFGVGTIDQGLLAALRTKFVFLRLFGLGQKVVIVDEVHAYDTYMSTILDRLLAWLGEMGAPVVLLSATLPSRRRRELLAAYVGAEVDVDAGYPGVAWVGDHGHGWSKTEVAERTIQLSYLHERDDQDLSSMVKAVTERLSGGGCVAVLRNTVARAQATFGALRAELSSAGIDVELIHARFCVDDRANRERGLVERYGPGDEGRPDRAVVVATQVMEQSLDVDFDVMFSDFAPLDLLVQRAGRMHRHDRRRPGRLTEPELVVCGFERDPSTGLGEFPTGTKAVYDEYILQRSWLALDGRNSLRSPDEVGPLIDAVYCDDPASQLLGAENVSAATEEQLSELSSQSRLKADEHEHEAALRFLPPPPAVDHLADVTGHFAEDDPGIHPKLQARTRLGDPSVSVVLLFDTDRGPSLTADGSELVDLSRRPNRSLERRLLGRSVDLSHRSLTFILMDEPVPEGWQQSPWLRRHRVVLLDTTGAVRVGKMTASLDNDLGVVLSRSEE